MLQVEESKHTLMIIVIGKMTIRYSTHE